MAHWTRISGYITIYPGQFDQFITDKFYELEDEEAKDWEVTDIDFNVADYVFSLFKDMQNIKSFSSYWIFYHIMPLVILNSH